ncbi:MAG TPA: hypothetical protein VFS43_06020 [Polyangiaceae bacterium]|nr:hypothetical protein [Polyangiaceae bacterium]
MKTRHRSGWIALLSASFGLAAALLAGGCAEPDDGDAGRAASEQVAEEGGDEAHIEGGDHLDLLTHPMGCQCGVCTGGRQASR